MGRIKCFDSIKHKEVRQLQKAFYDLVPEDTDLSEQEQKEIGKKIALDYYKQVNEELADLKQSIKEPTKTELPEALNRIMDKSITIGDNYYSGKIKSIEKTKRGYAITDSKGQTVNVIFDKGILLSDEIQGDMSGVIPPYRPVAVQTSDGWQTVRKTTSEIQQEINQKREKVEKIEEEAEKEVKKVNPKIPITQLPVKARVAQRKVRDIKLSNDIDAALNDLKKSGGPTFTTGGIDPVKLEKAVKIISLYMKAGVYKLSDIIEDAYSRMGEEIKELFDLIKTAYGGYYMNGATKEEAKKMDLSERDLTFNDITQDMTSEVEPVEDFEKIEKAEPKRQFIDAVKQRIAIAEKQNIISLRKLAAELGIDVVDTHLQEMVEMAVVELSREIADSNFDELQKLKAIIDVYENQPTISMRSAERIEKQQYSTPAPTAYLSGLFVAAGNPQSVFEPSAGNGIMTIAFKPSIVTVNEIDKVRLDNLSDQGFKQVTDQDALQPFPISKRDGIVMNPPFGSSAEIDIKGYKISGLDEQMIVNALTHLAPNGRAAIIMGGHNRYDEKGRLINERTFFNYLHHYYNVAAVLNISGQLYQKQGTQFPTRLILINGIKENPEGATPLSTSNPVISSFYDLFKIIKVLKNEKYGTQNILQSGMDANNGIGNDIHGEGSTGLQGNNKTGLSSIPGGQVQSVSEGSNPTKRTPGESNGGHIGNTNTGNPNTTGIGTGNNAIGSVPVVGANIPSGEQPRTGNNIGTGNGEFQRNDIIHSARKFGANELSENEKVNYIPKSKGRPVGTVIPSQMATDAEKILTDIDNKFGGIDNFVQQKLKYPDKESLFKALSGEQIDAVAMAIVQIEDGQGMIIGDMTGVGKGRIAAAVLRYAVNQGKKPIFLTENPGLFSDFYRDLLAIGSENLTPFIVNDKSNSSDPTITDENGNIVHKVMSAAQKKTIFANKKIPENADFVLATYSQFRSNPDKPSIKKDFFLSAAQGNVLILDESHNVSGDSNSGQLFQDVLSNAQGVTYLSATFAKRPDNMPVYAIKTAMQEANMTKEELISAIETGGVALQEVVASQLVESGQMLRRERTFEGVTIDYEVLDEVGQAHREIADNVTEIIRDIIDFQATHVAEVIAQLDSEAAAAGGTTGTTQGTNMAGVSNTPFASKVFNVIDQLLFSIKANDIADAAIEELKADRKPVIGFKSTMGSFLAHLEVAPGEVLGKTDFSLTLKRALEGVMRFTEKDAQGNAVHRSLSQADLSEEGRAKYQEILDKIIKASLGISISPIDVMIKRIQDAGYTVKEITGRNLMLELQDDGTAIVVARTERDNKKTVREFNNGNLDVVMLNVSGATGISLHASKDFKDQRKRVMIDGQLELDVNKAVQKRGRIDRTGQVVRGAYRHIVSAIQAEKRLLMMFKSKLKSLDANTTSSQKSAQSDVAVVDFINKYGDEIVTEYLKEERELNDKLLDPLKMDSKSDDELDGMKSVEGAARKVTGRVAILNTKDQETFYKEVTDRYIDLMEYLESNNSNDLEVKVLPLNATTLSKSVIVAGKGGETPFGQDSYLEQIEADILKKPFKKEDIDKEVQEGLEGMTAEQKSEEILDGITEHYEKVIEGAVAKIEKQNEINKITVAETARKKALKEGSLDVEGDVAGSLERLEFAKKEAINRVTTKNTFIKNNLSRLARYFKIGNLYEVPVSVRTDTTVGTSKGIFLGFNIKKSRKNPYAPSAINMRFAVNDSRRLVTIPLSKQDFINAVIANSSFLTQQAKDRYIESWDSLQTTRTREHRFMVTGNLLQAYGTNDGQLVSYTDNNGGLRKGILLPENYKLAEQKIRIPIGGAAKYLINAGDKITTVDKEVTLQKESTGFTITVPLSKSSGGKYFLNKGLQALVNDRGFNQMAGKMTAYFSDSKLQDVLSFLQSTYNSSIETDTKITKADLLPENEGEIDKLKEKEVSKQMWIKNIPFEKLNRKFIVNDSGDKYKVVGLPAIQPEGRLVIQNIEGKQFTISTNEDFYIDSNSIDYAVAEDVSEDLQDVIDVVQEQVDNGVTSLNAIQDIVAEGLDDYSEEMRNQVADAYNEYTKRFTPDEINQAINQRISKNLSTAFGGINKVQVLNNDTEIREKADELGNVQYNMTPEQKATQELLDNATNEYQKAKKAFDAKRKELDKTVFLDQQDLFGERKSTEQNQNSLFDERVSQSGRDKAMEPFIARMVKAEKEVTRLQQKLNNLGNQSAQTSLFMKSPEGNVLGFTSGGVIYLNSKYLNPNTPIHESSHILLEWMKQNDTKVYDRGIELISGSQYLDKVKANKFYIDEAEKLPEEKREEYFKQEALATAIGDKGGQFVTEAKKKGFAEWLKNLWETIKNTLGLKNITAKELSELTLDEFAKRAAADILREQKTPQPQQQPTKTTYKQSEDETGEDVEDDNTGEISDPIAEYEMTTTEIVKNYLSGQNLRSSMGYEPENSQGYLMQKRTEMLQDGKAMIGHAMGIWGTDIADYGKPLFGYIQRMPGGNLAKKVVLMATFIGEISEEINRNPSRTDEFKPLQNAVTEYYQKYMNQKGKEVSAGALLRLYRDKYMGDLFQDQILEENEVKEKNELRKLQEQENIVKAAEEAAIEEYKRITQEQKDIEDAEAAEKENDNQKKNKNKKKLKATEAQKMAAQELQRMKQTGGDVSTLNDIKERIKNLLKNCK